MRRAAGALWALLVLAVASPVQALAPEDFAYGIKLEPEGAPTALWRVQLPEPVYRAVTRTDLGDLRVFNAAGASVPHMLSALPDPAEHRPPPVNLPFFALRGEDARRMDTSVRVLTDERGSIVEIQSDPNAPAAGEPRVTAYLIDAGTLSGELTGLAMDWERRRDDRHFAVSVSVDFSPDLVRWRPWVPDATVADMRAVGGEHILFRNEIPLPPVGAGYLRLSWPEPLEAVTLTGVRGLPRAVRDAPDRHWQTVPGVPVPDAQMESPRVAYQFDTGGRFPVDRLRVIFPVENAVVHGTLKTRADPADPWQSRARGTFYQVHREGLVLQGEPVALAPTPHRYWLFEAGPGELVHSAGTPSLEVGWRPRVLTFIAQGAPPFTLAYGSAGAAPAPATVNELLRILGDEGVTPVRGVAGEVFSLGGEGRLHPAPEPRPIPWRTVWLWSVLVLGALLMVWMVRAAYRQLQADA